MTTRLKSWYLFILLIPLAVIIPLFVILFVHEQKSKPLKNLNSTAQKLTEFSPGFQSRIMKKLDILDNAQTSDEEKYKAITDLVFFYGVSYSEKNDPAYKNYVDLLNSYAKEKFPDLYKAGDFFLACQDTSCSDSDPSEVKPLLDLIAKSDFPSDIKASYTLNINNITLMEEKYKEDKAAYYYSVYVSIRTNSLISSSSALPAIKDEFSKFLNKKYSNETKGFEEEYKKTFPLIDQ